jgi:hypothetical protein
MRSVPSIDSKLACHGLVGIVLAGRTGARTYCDTKGWPSNATNARSALDLGVHGNRSHRRSVGCGRAIEGSGAGIRRRGFDRRVRRTHDGSVRRSGSRIRRDRRRHRVGFGRARFLQSRNTDTDVARWCVRPRVPDQAVHRRRRSHAGRNRSTVTRCADHRDSARGALPGHCAA